MSDCRVLRRLLGLSFSFVQGEGASLRRGWLIEGIWVKVKIMIYSKMDSLCDSLSYPAAAANVLAVQPVDIHVRRSQYPT